MGLILKEIFLFTHSGVKPSIKFFVEREICKSPSRGFIYPLVSICFYHFTNLQFCHGLCNTLYFFVYSPLAEGKETFEELVIHNVRHINGGLDLMIMWCGFK